MTVEVTHERDIVTTDKDGGVTSFDDVITERWQDADIAAKQSLSLPLPRYITGPGSYAAAFDGSLLSMDAAGAVYLNGRRMPGIAAQKIAIVGKSIYGLGKTIPAWWLWGGTNWGGAPVPMSDLDPGIFG